METVKTFNILIVGKAGSGKSATAKLLTGDPSILVGNGPKEVTTAVTCFAGASLNVNGEYVQFKIMDIPGLDKFENRGLIREQLLCQLEKNRMSLHAIIYLISLTERDSVDSNKLFLFLEALPWQNELKKAVLIPVFSKYDNLVFDSPDEEVQSTMAQFRQIFQQQGYSSSWNKRIYWINQTKSLDHKIKVSVDIRDKYEKQIERLVNLLSRNKLVLTADSIRETIQLEEKFILKHLFENLSRGDIPFRKQSKKHSLLVTIIVEPRNMKQSFMAVSASSIGLCISKVCQKDLPTTWSVVMLTVPVTIALLKLFCRSNSLQDKKVMQQTSEDYIIKVYESMCKQINSEMEREWKAFNDNLLLEIVDQNLQCIVSNWQGFKFFDFSSLELSLSCGTNKFSKKRSENNMIFSTEIPSFQNDTTWTPEIRMSYYIKRFDDEGLLRFIEQLRRNFVDNFA